MVNYPSSIHLYDCAGVSASLTSAMFTIGVKAISVTPETDDIFGFSYTYPTQNAVPFTLSEIIDVSSNFSGNYDIVHLNFFWPYLKNVYDRFPGHKKVMHYHGSDVRSSDTEKRTNAEKEFADAIFVATPDLLEYEYGIDNVHYIPTPIDTTFFNTYKRTSDKKFSILRSQHDIEKFNSKLKELNIDDVRIFHREHEFRQYHEQPEFYSRFGTYIQLIWDKVKNDWVNSLSKTALECLASGLDVITSDGKKITEFPEEHNLLNVTMKVLDIYKSL